MSRSDEQYYKEVELVDNFYEFHRDIFDVLNAVELSTLVDYYRMGIDSDSPILSWRDEHVARQDNLDTKARAALQKALNEINLLLP